MSTFLKLLPLELSGIKEFIEPSFKTESGDHVVGDMSDADKRLHTLGHLLEKDAAQYQLDAHYCNDPVRKEELEAKAHELKMKSGILTGLMWISIRDELGLWDKNIGVRKGFTVVERPDNDNDDLSPFLRGLFGGGL